MKGRRLMEIKATVKMAARSWLTMVFMAVLVLMFFPALVSGNETVSIIVNALVMIAALAFSYASGANMGEGEISYGELIDKRVEKGYKPLPEDKARCYNRKRGAIATFLGMLPWIIMALIVLISGRNFVHVVAEEQPDYLFPAAETTVMTTHETIDVVARVMFAAFLGLYQFIDDMGPGMLDYFFLPFSFIYPLAIYIGYLTGPIQHKKKLKMIEEGKKKKLRKIRADQRRKRRQQQPREQKPEV